MEFVKENFAVWSPEEDQVISQHRNILSIQMLSNSFITHHSTQFLDSGDYNIPNGVITISNNPPKKESTIVFTSILNKEMTRDGGTAQSKMSEFINSIFGRPIFKAEGKPSNANTVSNFFQIPRQVYSTVGFPRKPFPLPVEPEFTPPLLVLQNRTVWHGQAVVSQQVFLPEDILCPHKSSKLLKTLLEPFWKWLNPGSFCNRGVIWHFEISLGRAHPENQQVRATTSLMFSMPAMDMKIDLSGLTLERNNLKIANFEGHGFKEIEERKQFLLARKCHFTNGTFCLSMQYPVLQDAEIVLKQLQLTQSPVWRGKVLLSDSSGQGFHRTLRVSIQARRKQNKRIKSSNKGESQNFCQLLLLQTIPNELFVDVDELKSFSNSIAGYDVQFFGPDEKIDIEIPAQASPSHAIAFMYSVDTKLVDPEGDIVLQTDFHFPVHFRYQQAIPKNVSFPWVSIEMSPPEVFAKCPHLGSGQNEWANILPVTSDTHFEPVWPSSPTLEMLIPTGQLQFKWISIVVTLGVSVLGCIIILHEVLKASKPTNSAKKKEE